MASDNASAMGKTIFAHIIDENRAREIMQIKKREKKDLCYFVLASAVYFGESKEMFNFKRFIAIL